MHVVAATGYDPTLAKAQLAQCSAAEPGHLGLSAAQQQPLALLREHPIAFFQGSLAERLGVA